MTTSSINLDYRLLPCGCFAVSLKGLPICCSPDPIVDAAIFLKQAGIADETKIRMDLEGSDVGISFFLHNVISESECELDESPKSDNGPQTRH
jgi:hypothetical protein